MCIRDSPTIVTWPTKIKSGTISDHPSTFYDFFATVSDIIGNPLSNRTDGISYYPSLTGKEQKVHEYLYWEFPAYGGQQAIRIDMWKGIKRDLFKGSADLQLYDLNKDKNNGILILDSKVDSVGVCDKIGALRVDLTAMMFKNFPGKNDKVEKITIPALRVNSC